MSCLRLLSVVFCALATMAWAADRAPEKIYESPSGAFHILDEGAQGRPVILFKANPKKQVAMPYPSVSKGDDFVSESDDEFHASPDDHWLYGAHHVGSGLRDANLFHIVSLTEVVKPKPATPFSKRAWATGEKIGALSENFSSEGVYAMTHFVGWSSDSARLLIRLGGGEKKSAFTERFIYFNTKTESFEVTDYLRRLNKLKDAPGACAEPLTPLPDEATLQAGFTAADADLNRRYAAKLAKLDKNEAGNLRDEQRYWLKQRDAGIAPYVASFPAAEKERRRLQYLAAVTIARSDEVPWFPQ